MVWMVDLEERGDGGLRGSLGAQFKNSTSSQAWSIGVCIKDK